MSQASSDLLRILPTIGMTPYRARIVEAGNDRIRAKLAEMRAGHVHARREAEAAVAAAQARIAAENARDAQIANAARDGRNWHPATLILREVAEQHSLTPADLKGTSRKAPIVRARQEAAYRIMTEIKSSYLECGRRLGDRDHTTILNAVRRHKARLAAEGGGA